MVLGWFPTLKDQKRNRDLCLISHSNISSKWRSSFILLLWENKKQNKTTNILNKSNTGEERDYFSFHVAVDHLGKSGQELKQDLEA